MPKNRKIYTAKLFVGQIKALTNFKDFSKKLSACRLSQFLQLFTGILQ